MSEARFGRRSPAAGAFFAFAVTSAATRDDRSTAYFSKTGNRRSATSGLTA
jgi:hypothetical protein